MSKYNFHYPIEVRLADLDAFWHVNNTKFLVYMEHARSQYLQEMGVFDRENLWHLPLIVGDVHCRYHNPILLGDKVIVSLGVTRISNKTVSVEYELTGEGGAPLYATGESILVAYDYNTKQSMPINDELRRKFSEREGKEF
jgi:acyl-CoA thioester hydrolase